MSRRGARAEVFELAKAIGVEAACIQLGFSTPWFYRWKPLVEEHGPAILDAVPWRGRTPRFHKRSPRARGLGAWRARLSAAKLAFDGPAGARASAGQRTRARGSKRPSFEGGAKLVPVTQAVYYRDSDGREPVDDFIAGLKPAAVQEAIDTKCDLLNGLPLDAPPLAFPHSSQVEGQLRELRCRYGKRLFRVLYRRSGNLFVLLHAIEKNTKTLEAADIATAKGRFSDFQARMNASPRTPPRAAGHDAPRIRSN